jgi:hypothetical protein
LQLAGFVARNEEKGSHRAGRGVAG